MFNNSLFSQANSTLKLFQKTDNNLIAIYTDNNFKLLSYDAEEVLNISSKSLNKNISAIIISPDSKLLAFCVNSYIYIFHIQTKVIINSINLLNEVVDKFTFDLESKYIIIATKSAKILQYRYNNSSLLSNLHSFKVHSKRFNTNIKPFISLIKFNNFLLVVATDDGTIFLINLYSKNNKITIKNNTQRITSLSFIKNILVSGDCKGNLYFNSLKNGELIKKLETGFTKIIQLLPIENSHYIMVLGDSNFLMIYDTKNFKLIHSKYMEFKENPQKAIFIDRYTLLILFKSFFIKKVKLSNPTILKSLILNNMFNEVYTIVQKDSMLKESDEFIGLEQLYTKTYNQTLTFLLDNNKEKALQTISIFQDIKSKKDDIKSLFEAFEYYERFNELFIQEKYALFYQLSTKYPPLQKTTQYKKLEEQFNKDFIRAQKFIKQDNYEDAKEILSKYATVIQKKAILKLILNYNDDFIRFLQCIESKKFKDAYQITKDNELFTQLSVYKDIKKELDFTKIDTQKLNDESEIIQELTYNYENNDFLKSYELLDKHNSLNYTELGFFLQKHWANLISKCEDFALNGNFKDLRITLGELITIKTRRDTIGDSLRLSFYSQIKILIDGGNYHKAETIIYFYIDIFSIDKNIIEIMKIYENNTNVKLAITQNQNRKVDKDSWIYCEMIMGGLVHNAHNRTNTIVKLIN